MKTVGSRAEVMRGTAKHTSGGLRKQHLTYNKRGKIVSKRVSARSKTKKGVNSLKKKNRRSRRRSRRTSSKRTSSKRKSNKRKSGRRKSSRRKSGRRKTRRNMQRGSGNQPSHVISDWVSDSYKYLLTELGGDEEGRNLITAKLLISLEDLRLLIAGLEETNPSWANADFPHYKKERTMLLTILNGPVLQLPELRDAAEEDALRRDRVDPARQILVPGSTTETEPRSVTVNTSDIGCVMGRKWSVCMHATLKTPTPLSDIRNMAKQYLNNHPNYAILHEHDEGNCQTYASYMFEKTTKMHHPLLRAHNRIALPCSMNGKAPLEYEINTNVDVSMDNDDESNLHWPEGGNHNVLEILIIKCGVHAVIVLKIDTEHNNTEHNNGPSPWIDTSRRDHDHDHAYAYASAHASAHAHDTGQNQSKTPPLRDDRRPRLLSWNSALYFPSDNTVVMELIINLKLPEGDGVLKYTKTYYDDPDGRVYIPNLEESVCSRALCPGERQWDCQEKCKITRKVPKAHLKIYVNGDETAITSAKGKLSRFPWDAPTDAEDWDKWANNLEEYLA